MRSLAMITACLLVLPSIAQAQDKGKKTSGAGEAKVKKFDFTADTLEGELIKPDGSAMDALVFGKGSSLIRIRRDFIAEILKSAQDI